MALLAKLVCVWLKNNSCNNVTVIAYKLCQEVESSINRCHIILLNCLLWLDLFLTTYFLTSFLPFFLTYLFTFLFSLIIYLVFCVLQWRAVARELFGVIRIGAVNCGDDWVLCRQKGIHSYPTLVLFPEVLYRLSLLTFYGSYELKLICGTNWNNLWCYCVISSVNMLYTIRYNVLFGHHESCIHTYRVIP